MLRTRSVRTGGHKAIWPRWRHYWHPCLVVFVILMGFTLVVLSRLDHLAWSDDEAVFVLTVRAVAQGGRLYDEVWFNYPPGLRRMLSSAFTVGGPSLTTARVAVLCCALVALLLVGALSWRVSSRWGAVLALLLLATAPHFVVLSGAVMAEIPAATLATGAVGLILSYRRTARRSWLVLSGMLLAGSLWVKPTGMLTGLVLLLAIWLTESTTERRLASSVLLAGSILLPLAVGLLPHNPLGFLRQSGLTYLRSRTAFEFDPRANVRDLMGYFLRDKCLLGHASLLLLATYGWGTLWRRRPSEALLLGGWLAGVTVTTLIHAPLYRHHLAQLLFPVAVLAGAGLATACTGLLRGQNGVRRGLHCTLLAVTVVELLPSLYVEMVTLPRFESDNAEMGHEAAEFLRGTTDADEYVITDAHIIALAAGRPVPPGLTNTSRMRIKTGQLTGQQVIDIARRVQPGAIVFWEEKLDSLQDFATWVACHYDLAADYGEQHRIYQPRRSVVLNDIGVPLDVTFGTDVRLLGYSVVAPHAAAAGTAEVRSFWKAINAAQADLRVFVHSVDAHGAILDQHDGVPGGGQCPTWVWQPGEVIADGHPLDLLSGEGCCRLAVGLYHPDGRRVGCYDSPGNSLPSRQVVVSLPRRDAQGGLRGPTPQYRQQARLGDYVGLVGYDLPGGSIRAGDPVSLTIYWRCLANMTTRYTVFVHLLDQTGQIVPNKMGCPTEGSSSRWAGRRGGGPGSVHTIPAGRASDRGLSDRGRDVRHQFGPAAACAQCGWACDGIGSGPPR